MRAEKYFAVCASLLLVFSMAAYAEEDSTRVVQERQTARVILTEVDFERLNCESVGDALKTITGVYVNAQGEVMLRDVSSSKVVVILDGQKLNVAGGTGVNVSNISIETIESVELLRGGRSAQFGADAVGGVIVITSKSEQVEGKQYSISTRTTYGSQNRRIGSLNYSMTLNRFNYLVSYRRDLWDGDFEYTDPYDRRIDMINNNESAHTVFGKVGYDIAEGQSLQGSYSLYSADNGTPGMTDHLTTLARIRFDNYSYNLNYNRARLFRDYNLDARCYLLNVRTRFDNPEGTVPVHSDHKNYALGVDIKQSGTLGEWFTLSYGYSLRNDEIESTDVGSKMRDTHSAFTTLTVSNTTDGLISAWDVALAMRYDDPTDFDSEFSPRLSLSVTNQGFVTTTLVSHVTESYRAPTFNDLYWPRDAFAIGNPDLKPEYGFNYDVGLNISVPVSSSSFSAAVNYFRNDVTDLILWAQDPEVNNLWTPNNISETSTWGVETSTTASFLEGLFAANLEYTYMEARDKGPDPNRHNKLIIYRPKNKLSATGTLHIEDFEVSVIYSYMGLRYTKPANTVWLPKFSLLDCYVSYGFNFFDLGWTTTFEVTNILDEDYQRVMGTAQPGQQYKVSLRLYI